MLDDEFTFRQIHASHGRGMTIFSNAIQKFIEGEKRRGTPLSVVMAAISYAMGRRLRSICWRLT
jgi:hypothetical protein